VCVAGSYQTTAALAEDDDEQVVVTFEPGGVAVTFTATTGERVHVVVLDPDQSMRAWTPTLLGRRHLVLSDAEIVTREGALLALAETSGIVEVFDTGTRTWRQNNIYLERPASPVEVTLVRGASGNRPVPRSFDGRASAPTQEEIREHGARYRMTIRSVPANVERAVLRVDLIGDVAQISRPGAEPFDDLFWSGEPWTIDLAGLRGSDQVTLDLDVTPVRQDPAVWLAPHALREVAQRGSIAEIQAAELILTQAIDITSFVSKPNRG
jgi:hypothetical protein